MFQVERFERITQGSYRVTLTTDDPGFLPALRLLRGVSALAEKLDERIDRERRILRLIEDRQANEPAAIAERAKILSMYRELPGARAHRLKLLRSVLKDQYPRIGYDDVIAVISRAVREERAARRARSVELSAAGRSAREIGRQLGISPAQASRLSRSGKGDARGCPTIDDLPSPAYPRSVPFGASSLGEKFQEETGIPERGGAVVLMGRGVRGR